MTQCYIDSVFYEKEISLLLQKLSVRHVLLVCGASFRNLPICSFIENLQSRGYIAVKYFSDFSPNPKYTDVLKGVKAFHDNNCDFIWAVGGGSAIDVAKCIKLFAGLKTDKDYLEQEITGSDIPLLAVPTTAGTGSEATKFAVIYVDGIKHSVEHESALPQYVLLYPDNLITLPDYQRKATMCDALAHAVESFWSVHSSVESRQLSEKAIHLILDNMDDFLANKYNGNRNMMLASNFAGQAINITKTTSAHAMCYKITSMLNIPHGHAVMLCLPEVWEYMWEKLNTYTDKEDRNHLSEKLTSLTKCFHQDLPEDAILFLKQLRLRLGLDLPKEIGEAQIASLVDSVNVERLKNFPIEMPKEDLNKLYINILQRN